VLVLALLFAAPLRAGDAPVSLRIETIYLQPDIDASTRGGGAGASLAYRLTDQLSAIAGASESLLWLPVAGAQRESQHLTMLAAGLEGLLDATPIAPFLEASIVRLIPRTVGYSVALRTALGADWRFAPPVALGLAVRVLTPLDRTPDATVTAGAEVAVRLTWIPGSRR
jgi:hypothetical protein